jgi:hypothetical protein
MIGPVIGIGTGNMGGYIKDWYPEPSRKQEMLDYLEEHSKKKEEIKKEQINTPTIIELQKKIIELQERIIQLERDKK